MALHNEIEFGKEICEHLGSNGWLYDMRGLVPEASEQ